MTFTHNFLRFGECDDLDTVNINGKRHYMVNGKPYPSVTTVLGSVPKPALEDWRRKVGEAKAAAITFQAAERGKALHSLIEDYLLNKTIDISRSLPHIAQMFTWIKPILDENITQVYGVESALYSDSLAMAGRADLIADWRYKPAIIDFKTSTKQKRIEYLDGYFQQAATYSYMVYERIGLVIPKSVIIVATEATSRAEIFTDRCIPRIPQVEEIAFNYHNSC